MWDWEAGPGRMAAADGKGYVMANLTIENVEHSGGIALMARKGSGTVHYMRTAPVMIGSFDVDKLCGGRLGSTSDASVELGTDLIGNMCKRCSAIYGRMLDAQRATGEESGTPVIEPVSVPGDVSESTPGNTDRVAAALESARARAAQMESGTDTGEVSEPVRELTPEDIKAAVKASKRGAAERTREEAVAAERKRLEEVREHRLTLATRHAMRGTADKFLTPRAVKTSTGVMYAQWSEDDRWTLARSKDMADAVRSEPGGLFSELLARVENGTTGEVSESAPVPARIVPVDDTSDIREAVREFYAAGGAKPQEVLAVESRGSVDGVRADHEWARVTDGKCAVVVPGEDGEPVTVTLSGRMRLATATAIAELVKCDVIPVGKTSGALAPVSGTDADGLHGVCPVCRREVKVTNSGAVGTHRPSGETPDAPQLPGREIPAVDVKGEPTRDAAKRREGEAYVREVTVTLDPMAPVADQVAAVLAAVHGDKKAAGVREVTRAVVEKAERSGVTGLMGGRNHGRGDGVGMSPRGETGYAGWTFDRGEAVIDESETFAEIRESRVRTATSPEPMVGGRFGHLTHAQYAKLSAKGRKRYRTTLNRRERAARAAREAVRDAAMESGTAKRGRPVLGSSNEGSTADQGAYGKHTDVAVVRVGVA